MKKLVATILACLAAVLVFTSEAATVTFAGNSLKVLSVNPEKDTGLDMIYVAYNLRGVSMTFTDPSATPTNVKWYRYSNLGGGYAEEIAGVDFDGTSSTISDVKGDMGYIVEYGNDRRYYFWLTEYEPKRLTIRGIAPSEEQSCDATLLDLDYTGEPIRFFTITGQQRYLDQEIKVAYSTMKWSEVAGEFEMEDAETVIDYPRHQISIRPAVLAQTFFTVTGDRFLKEWNWEQKAESANFRPVAIDARTTVMQEGQDENEDEEGSEDKPGSNIIGSNTSGLGGSAPAEISFKAFVTEGVYHDEWQMGRDPEFNNVDYRFNVRDLDYTFTEEGTFYLRYVGSNYDGTCEAYGETYTVSIGASEIKCPNAFSPGASPGVNDEWKVSYRSIVKFDCHIFNRYGVEMCHLTDPSQGWDGKYHGKLVPSGVYYYVIQAEGADGKNYKLSGDINIVGYRMRGAAGSATGGESAD